MSEIKADIAKLKFTSTVFPNADDMALWNSLTPEEQRALIERDEEAGFASGVAPDESFEARLARVRDL